MFKCEECSFSTSLEQGLKTHNKRKHIKTYKQAGNFPTNCEFCEIEVKSKLFGIFCLNKSIEFKQIYFLNSMFMLIFFWMFLEMLANLLTVCGCNLFISECCILITKQWMCNNYKQLLHIEYLSYSSSTFKWS